MKNYLDAILDFTFSIEIDPNDPDQYNHRGITFRELKKYHKSIEDFKKTLLIDSKNAVAL